MNIFQNKTIITIDPSTHKSNPYLLKDICEAVKTNTIYSFFAEKNIRKPVMCELREESDLDKGVICFVHDSLGLDYQSNFESSDIHGLHIKTFYMCSALDSYGEHEIMFDKSVVSNEQEFPQALVSILQDVEEGTLDINSEEYDDCLDAVIESLPISCGLKDALHSFNFHTL